MNKKRSTFDPAFISSLKIVDIDEVSYLALYGGENNQVSAPQQPAHQHTSRRPLIDVVTPQPKAFFAYLRMPEPEQKTPTKTTSRIKRTRKRRTS